MSPRPRHRRGQGGPDVRGTRLDPSAHLGLLFLVAAAFGVSQLFAAFTASESNGANAFTTDTLDPPSAVVAADGATITITWTATPDAYAAGHRVLRSGSSGGPYSQIAQVTPRTTTSYIDAPASGTYYYVVRAFVQNWESSNSNEDAGTVTSGCTAGDTGFQSPSAEAADVGSPINGADDGFELNPTSAFADDAAFASDINSAGDRHRYFNYGRSLPGGCLIAGIEVQVDWWLDKTAGPNSLSVDLSWDGGTSWTAAQTDTIETTTEHTTILGGVADTWGRTWALADFTDANFRLRVHGNTTNEARDYFLDWVTVKVHYAP